MQFKRDGTFRAAGAPDRFEDYAFTEGEFWFEGGQLFLKDIAAFSYPYNVCVGKPAGSYEVQVAVKDRFTLVAIDDPCKDRADLITSAPFLSTSVPPTMTVTFDGNECTYDGPETVSVGQIIVNWNIEDQDQDKYGLAIVTLDEDKTFEDLDAWPSVAKPPWAKLLAFEEVYSAGRSTVVADVTEGPIFLVCFTAYPETKIGVLGPVEVVD